MNFTVEAANKWDDSIKHLLGVRKISSIEGLVALAKEANSELIVSVPGVSRWPSDNDKETEYTITIYNGYME